MVKIMLALAVLRASLSTRPANQTERKEKASWFAFPFSFLFFPFFFLFTANRTIVI